MHVRAYYYVAILDQSVTIKYNFYQKYIKKNTRDKP